MGQYQKARFLDRSTPPHIITLISLAGISALAMTVFLPSLPGIALYFETDYAVLQLSVALYLGVNAALQIVLGPLSDRFGRRPVILTGMLIFLMATLGCIFAQTATSFLSFRMLQAFIVVAMVLSRAVIRDMVPKEQAASMIAYVTMGMAVVPMVGPAIGGLLDQAFDWAANFWLLFGLGALITLMAWADMGETAPAMAATSENRSKEYAELLKSPRFWGYAAAAALPSGSFFAYLGGAPFVGAQIFHLTPAQLGLYFGAPAIGYFLGNFISGRFSTQVGINRMVLWGTQCNAAGIGINILMFVAGQGSAISFFGLMVFMGLGNGMTIPMPQLAPYPSGPIWRARPADYPVPS